MENFVGTFRLVDQISIHPSGRTDRPRGENPGGVLMYTADGRMSVHLMRTDRASTGDLGSLEVALNEYLSYFGVYTVDEAAGTITHHIEGCSYPGWIGTAQTRKYAWEGNMLILRAAAGKTTRILTWVRISR